MWTLYEVFCEGLDGGSSEKDTHTQLHWTCMSTQTYAVATTTLPTLSKIQMFGACVLPQLPFGSVVDGLVGRLSYAHSAAISRKCLSTNLVPTEARVCIALLVV